MIRIFSLLYAVEPHKLSDAKAIFMELKKKFHPGSERCAKCGAGGFLHWHDSYSRNLVTYEDGKVVDNPIDVGRVFCGSCNATSAVLPDILVPHKTYCLLFILSVLRASLLFHWTVTRLCEHFGISAATYYAWKAQYLSHKKLSLGVLEKYLAGKDGHLHNPISVLTGNFLHSFFARFGFSFLETSKTTEIRSP